VYKAIQLSTDKVVALKITIPTEERAPHNSKRELEILKRLSKGDGSRGIVEILNSFSQVHDGDIELIMVMPYFEYDLNVLLKKNSKALFPSGRRNVMAIELIQDIVMRICSSLAFIHSQGVIHRDIKPENILISENPIRTHLIDFGISWSNDLCKDDEPEGDKHTDVGTGVYRAPELLFGKRDYNNAIDLWSLGCIVCKLCSVDGQELFRDAKTDIALIHGQFTILGTPTVESWPELNEVDSFRNLEFTQYPAKPWSEIAPRANPVLTEILSGCLKFQSTERLSAQQICNTFNSSFPT
jgi:serine/threonine protein kinase